MTELTPQAAADTARRDAFRAMVAEVKRQRAAAELRIAAGLRLGSEWSNDTGTSFGLIVGDASAPSRVILRLFDARGFSGSSPRATLQLLVPELFEYLGTGVRAAPGALDRLAPGFLPAPDWIVVTRDPGEPPGPWIWHEERFHGDHQRAGLVQRRLLRQDLPARVLPVPIGDPLKAARQAAARAVVDAMNRD